MQAQLAVWKNRRADLRENILTALGRTSTASEEDEFGYMGPGGIRGRRMMGPALEEHVASVLAREAGAAKKRRKQREERGQQEPAPQKK